LAAVTASVVHPDREPVVAQPSSGDPLLVVDAAFAQSSVAFTEEDKNFVDAEDREARGWDGGQRTDFLEDALASGVDHISE